MGWFPLMVLVAILCPHHNNSTSDIMQVRRTGHDIMSGLNQESSGFFHCFVTASWCFIYNSLHFRVSCLLHNLTALWNIS